MQRSKAFKLNGHYRKHRTIQMNGRNTIKQTVDCGRLVLFAILFSHLLHKQRDIATCRLPQHLGKTKVIWTFSSLLLFRLSIQLCRLRSAHSFEYLVFSKITPLAAHRKSSFLVRGQNCYGGYCTCVASLYIVSDSLFGDVESFSSADSSQIMGSQSLQKCRR